jgi:hypothetical protein
LLEAARRELSARHGTRLEIVGSPNDDRPVTPGQVIEYASRDTTNSVRTGRIESRSRGRFAVVEQYTFGSDGLYGPWPVEPTEAGRALFLQRSYRSSPVVAMVVDWLEAQYDGQVQVIWTPTAQNVHLRQHLSIAFRIVGRDLEGLVDARWVSQDEGFAWEVTHTWPEGTVGGWPIDLVRDVLPAIERSG